MPIRPVGPAPRAGLGGSNFGTQPIGNPGMKPMPMYKKGGTVKKTGPAIVHKGERIIPAKKAKKK